MPFDAEQHPWRAIAYMIYTVQIMYITLDLAVDSGVDISWHNAVTTIEFIFAVFSAAYQVLRIHALVTSSSDTAEEHDQSLRRNKIPKALWLLAFSLFLQVVLAILAAASFSQDRRPFEWTMFAICILWALVHCATYAAVQDYRYYRHRQRPQVLQGTTPSPAGSVIAAVQSVITRHIWQREKKEPWLFVVIFLALSHAVLVAFEGLLIHWLVETSARYYSFDATTTNGGDDQDGGNPCFWYDCTSEIAYYAYTVVAVWFFAQAAHVLLEGTGAAMFMRLELWMREKVFARAILPSVPRESSSSDLARLQSVYGADIAQVVGLYLALQGILVNVLLAVANFVVLFTLQWKVAVLCLSLLALLATVSGSPSTLWTSSATSANLSGHVHKAMILLKESTGSQHDPNYLSEKHRHEVLVPLRSSLLRRVVYSDSAIGTYIGFFGSFLTIVVIISMAWDVVEGTLNPALCLAIFFVYYQVLGATTILPALFRLVETKTQAVRSVDAVLFDNNKSSSSERENISVNVAANEPTMTSPPPAAPAAASRSNTADTIVTYGTTGTTSSTEAPTASTSVFLQPNAVN